MDGQIFSNSLVALKGTELRMVYALLRNTNIGDLLSSKTKDLFSKEEQDHFTKHLEREVNKIKDLDDSVLQVNLFLEISKLLKLRGTAYTLQKEVEEQCAAIVREVYEQYLKQDKQFRSFVFVEENEQSTMLQRMVKFQMSKIFRELDDGFQDFSIEDQTKFASQVNEYIHSLPEQKQIKIKEKLGIDDLTDEMVRRAIALSGPSIVFAIIVEVGGFAFYTTATSLVATFAGLFGLTLPFGFYTGLTSTIAVLANPLFILPLLLGGGVLLVNHQNASLKKKLLPIVLMQITLPYMSKGDNNVEFDPFIQEWESRFNDYKNVYNEIKEIEHEQRRATEQIDIHKYEINNADIQIASYIRKRTNEYQKIKSALKNADHERLEISPSFQRSADRYRLIASKISELKYAKRKKSFETGFFNRIGSKVKKLTLSFDINNEEKKLDTILDDMTNEIIRSTTSFMRDERETFLSIENSIYELEFAKKRKEAEKKKQESLLRDLNVKHKSLTQKLKQLEKDNYGLSHVVINEVAVWS